MIIKNFKQGDLNEFLKLCKEFYDSCSTIKSFDEKRAKNTFLRVIENHENLWGYFIVDSKTDKKVGYGLVTSYWCNEDGGNVLVLDELYISPCSRHHGYGGRFMEWLEKEFKDKAVSLTLEVLTTNQNAKSLYNKEGLVPDGFVTYTKNI